MTTPSTRNSSPRAGAPNRPAQASLRRGSTLGSGGGGGGTKWSSASSAGARRSGSSAPVSGPDGSNAAGSQRAVGSAALSRRSFGRSGSGSSRAEAALGSQCATMSAKAASMSSPGSESSGREASGLEGMGASQRLSGRADPADELRRALEDGRGVVVEGRHVVAVLEDLLGQVARRHGGHDDAARRRVDDAV